LIEEIQNQESNYKKHNTSRAEIDK
jgi:hypothetical protein